MSAIVLDDYQIDAVNKMSNGCILCGGVGSGKSLTGLAYYYLKNGGDLNSYGYDDGCEYYPMGDPPKDLYIITTAMKRDKFEWDDELSRFLLSTEKEGNLYSNKVVIDSWNNIMKYVGVQNAFFIFDEDRVCGAGAWVKAFLKITKVNEWIILSATPGDKFEDYIPVFIANGFYKNRTEFTREHIVFSRFSKFPKVERYINTGRLARLRKKILVEMDFKRPTTSHHEDVMVPYDMPAYKRIFKDRWNPFDNAPIENAAELCYLLRRVVNSDISRQQELVKIYKDCHPRIIVFYSHDYERDILLNLNYGDDVEVAEWSGHAHQPIPSGPRWVYIVNYSAGAEGWNSVRTDTMVFYSQNYSYKTMIQAAGRIDRRNTPYKDLYYYHFKSYSGIDIAIGKALKEKKNFNEGKFAGSQ